MVNLIFIFDFKKSKLNRAGKVNDTTTKAKKGG